MSNADEFTWGYNPIDPDSYGELPAIGVLGRALLVVLVLATALVWLRRLRVLRG